MTLHFVLKAARLPMDRPNERSLHATPVPRSGGIVMIPTIAIVWLIGGVALPWPIWIALIVLFVLSLIDDLRGLPVLVRFAGHLVAAAAVAIGVLHDTLDLIVVGLTGLALAWMINLYNFMDGSDGLAGGMTLIGFTGCGIGAWLAGDAPLATTCLVIAGAAAGFLMHNFHPARVFLGDAGSIPLGLLAGALGLLGYTRGHWPAWFPILVFAPFILDATVTVVRRLCRGERIWQAHRSHYYQRLVISGFGHRRTALAEYVAMGCSCLVALFALSSPSSMQWALLAMCLAVYALLMVLIDRRWRRHAKEA